MWNVDLEGTHIMVPLDGSPLAERALPIATYVATALQATLVLAHITGPGASRAGVSYETIAAPTMEQPGHRVEDEQSAGRAYLDGVAQPLREQGVHVQVIVRQGVAAPALVELLAPLDIGLVVMTTHGRTGMARFALGSVADHVVRASHVPVLLLRPLLNDRGAERPDIQFARALVPLDGKERAEAALELAAALAGRLIHEVTLLRVVPLRTDQATEHAMEEADRYVEGVSGWLVDHLAGRAAVETRVLGGDPAEQIMRYAEKDFDLVIMATRGEIGTRRWVFGSVADRVLHDSTTPLLLIQPLAGPARPELHDAAMASDTKPVTTGASTS